MPLEYPSRANLRWQRLVEPQGWLRRGAFAARLRELQHDFDVVHCVGLGGSSTIPLLERPAVAQLDCVTRRDRDLAPPWRQEGRVTIELLRAERRVLRSARWVLGSSPEVADAFRAAAPHAHVAFAPLTLDESYYSGTAAVQEPIAGLIGTARWPVTANAVERLLTRVWPRVLERAPQARLRLAGFGMERAAFPGLPDLPGVEWCGTVDSANDFLLGLGLLLYPLGRGSGVKVKVLESMALGLPIVTTPDGAEGIISRDGLVVEEDDERLAASAAALLADPAARRAAGAAVKRSFAEHQAPAPVAERVVELYERMLGGAPRRDVHSSTVAP
ncbi:MAG TPA: glycosyltransferase [Conexibacter sp.]|nr:glycosyltransferase [Conexibacter sp.]